MSTALSRAGLNKTIELFDNGMCDGPILQVGKQYLMLPDVHVWFSERKSSIAGVHSWPPHRGSRRRPGFSRASRRWFPITGCAGPWPRAEAVVLSGKVINVLGSQSNN